MPAATGSFTFFDENFNGEFYPEGFVTIFYGILNNRRIPQFSVPTATITYDSLEGSLGKYRVYSISRSFVGPDTIDITFINDSDPKKAIHLTGQLASPIDTSYPVLGNGSWEFR